MKRPKSKPADELVAKSWRDVLPIHPACAAYPQIGAGELADLAADIRVNELQVEVVVFWDEAGKEWLLDGRSRLDALESNGINLIDKDGNFDRTRVPIAGKAANGVRTVRWGDEAENPFVLAASLNAHRRHLTPEQRRKIIETQAAAAEALVKAHPEKSDRQLAKDLGTDHKVVGRARKRAEATGAAPQLKRVGADGKARKVKPTAKASAKVVETEEPGVIKDNFLDTVSRETAILNAYKKVFAAADLDEGSKGEIRAAIGGLVSKWQSLERSTGTVAAADVRLPERFAELVAEKRALEIKIVGLESENSELRAKVAELANTIGRYEEAGAFLAPEPKRRRPRVTKLAEDPKSADDDIPPFLDRTGELTKH
jgi:hypothetical protein